MKKQNAQNSKPLNVWSLSLLILLLNCGPTPPDVPVCKHQPQRLITDDAGHLILEPSPICIKEINEAECGYCVYIISQKSLFIGEGEEHHLNGKPWSQVKEESVIVPAKESYAPLIAYIINACKKTKCTPKPSEVSEKLAK